jgi:hypothetical protein
VSGFDDEHELHLINSPSSGPWGRYPAEPTR